MVLNVSDEELNNNFNKLGEIEKDNLMKKLFNEFGTEVSRRNRPKAIYYWLRSNIKYDYDAYEMSLIQRTLDGLYSYDKASKAEDVFYNRKGVCAGMSNLAFWMMRLTRIPCAIVLNFDHAYNAIHIEDYNGELKWALIDVTWGEFPNQAICESNLRISNQPYHKIWRADASDFAHYIFNGCKNKLMALLLGLGTTALIDLLKG